MAARLMWEKNVAQNLDDMITNSIIQNVRRSSRLLNMNMKNKSEVRG
jgi:hypothetical protein